MKMFSVDSFYLQLMECKRSGIANAAHVVTV